jgi:hypothetical protein
MHYTGVIIEESLRDASVLGDIQIVETKVECVAERHETPWLAKWTLHTVAVPAHEAEGVANRLAKAIDTAHISSWYADFKNEAFHYVIFADRVFKLDNKKKADWDLMRAYALSVGLPPHQILDAP